MLSETQSSTIFSGDGVETLRKRELEFIKNALQESKGSIKQASQKLGISYKTLQYRMKKYRLDKRDYKGLNEHRVHSFFYATHYETIFLLMVPVEDKPRSGDMFIAGGFNVARQNHVVVICSLIKTILYVTPYEAVGLTGFWGA